jgi:hypothetical protein
MDQVSNIRLSVTTQQVAKYHAASLASIAKLSQKSSIIQGILAATAINVKGSNYGWASEEAEEETVTNMHTLSEKLLIAPCGINCILCRAYIKEKMKCPGCRDDSKVKLITCVTCKIKNCGKLKIGDKKFCFACSEYPCDRIKHLDKRYRTKYGTSVIANLLFIKKNGINEFLKAENIKWKCPTCGERICMHKPHCVSCGYAWNKIQSKYK